MSLNDLSVNLKVIIETKQAHNYFNQLAKKQSEKRLSYLSRFYYYFQAASFAATAISVLR